MKKEEYGNKRKSLMTGGVEVNKIKIKGFWLAFLKKTLHLSGTVT